MKASLPSGTSTSFYVHNGPYDTPSDAGRYYNDHNEIDVEFIGKDTTKVQTNYFSRPKIAGANSGSGNEELHDLGFDAAKEFAAYSFKWTHGNIDWFVNGRRIRSAYWQSSRPVPLQSYSTVRFVANIWPVNKVSRRMHILLFFLDWSVAVLTRLHLCVLLLVAVVLEWQQAEGMCAFFVIR